MGTNCTAHRPIADSIKRGRIQFTSLSAADPFFGGRIFLPKARLIRTGLGDDGKVCRTEMSVDDYQENTAKPGIDYSDPKFFEAAAKNSSFIGEPSSL
jgi:hypothetical protein